MNRSILQVGAVVGGKAPATAAIQVAIDAAHVTEGRRLRQLPARANDRKVRPLSFYIFAHGAEEVPFDGSGTHKGNSLAYATERLETHTINRNPRAQWAVFPG